MASSVEAEEVLRELLRRMDVPAEVRTGSAREPGHVLLEVTSEAGALLIGRQGQTLDALEYLTNRILGAADEHAARVSLDVEGYRERREHELREIAQHAAERVRQSGRPQTLNPLPARERRIIHMAISTETDVVTKSVGEGPLRQVVVSPAGR